MGRVLVLVAHADDESVGYGALLLRMREAVVVIATDGAPQDRYFWERFGSREAYAAERRDEARRAMRLAGVGELVLLADEEPRLEDQRLFLNLAAAYGRLEKLVERVRPEAIATLAYEGGHPDHDSCSVLGARLGEQFGVPVWEAPLYTRGEGRSSTKGDDSTSARSGLGSADIADPTLAKGGLGSTNIADPTLATKRQMWATREGTGVIRDGELRLQRFIWEIGGEVAVEIDAGEVERKRAMCAQYGSQGDFLQTFDVRREVVRPQAKYDYGRAPHAGRTNYEQWQWWMSAQDVSVKFAEFLESGS